MKTVDLDYYLQQVQRFKKSDEEAPLQMFINKKREVTSENCACCANCLTVYQPALSFADVFGKEAKVSPMSRCPGCEARLASLAPNADAFSKWL